MIRRLIPSWHPNLRSPACSVLPENREYAVGVAQDLLDTLLDLEQQAKAGSKVRTGVGLAAPQIGQQSRIIYIRGFGMNSALFNPRIESKTAHTTTDFEECLSLPGVRLEVPRAFGILLSYELDPCGPRRQSRYQHFLARVIQHEVDHLDGVLITSRSLDANGSTVERPGHS